MIERLIGVQLSLTHFSGYKVKKEPLETWILREFTGSETDDDLILRARRFIFYFLEVICLFGYPIMTKVWFHLTCGGQRCHSCNEIGGYHYPTRVMCQFARDRHILALCDTQVDLHRIQIRENDHTYWGTQHASHVEKIDDMAIGVIHGPPSFPTQIASLRRKSRLSSVGAWFLLVASWVALHLSMIFSRHF
ncbi:hypothetical protein M9H77_29733 [Catharanthus roseus]|uniref:Uncharacterized protein n=1 Tax=Catharanthus roseus TaxID=4058 RepID=A0ACB9ZZ46_CATRO|nr:hypothetical protein M9H77_29733 [Catharanthus roseus]